MKKYISLLLMVLILTTGMPEYIYAQPIEGQEIEAGNGDNSANAYDGTYRDVELPYPERKDSGLQAERSIVIPSEYDNRANLPAVRNQGSYGVCWAFSALAAAETAVIGAQKTIAGSAANINNTDFSEYQLAHFFYNSVDDPLGNTGGDKTIVMKNSVDQPVTSMEYLKIGGNSLFTTWSMAAWRASTAESTAPYSSISSTGGILDQSIAFANIAHMQNAYWIDFCNTTKVKEMIMEYGGVAFSYYAYQGAPYYYAANAAQYQDVETTTNHAVFVVGWDDNYSKENFSESCRPANDGAWLVRNSWGSSWGDGGYFWLSYEDKSITEGDKWGFVFLFEPADNYDYNYQYDGSCGRYYNIISSNGSVANRFDVYGTEYQQLEAISLGLYGENVNYSIQIYLNPETGNPASGTPLLSQPQTGTTDYVGYHTIPLNEEVILAPGAEFAVVVTFPEGAYCFVDKTYANGTWIRFVSDTAPNQSFQKTYSSSPWRDLNQDGGSIRLKAFTNEIAAPAGPSELSERIMIKANATDGTDGLIGIYSGISLVDTKALPTASDITLNVEKVYFSDHTILPVVTMVTDTSGNKIPYSEYEITYPEVINALGKYHITVTFKESSEKYEGQLQTEFEVEEDVSKRTIGITKADADTGADGEMVIYSYGLQISKEVISAPAEIVLNSTKTEILLNDDTECPQVIAVKDCQGNVIPDSEYTVDYPAALDDLKTYAITITFKETSEKYRGRLRASFELIEDTSTRTTNIIPADADTGEDGRIIISNYGKELSNTAIAAPKSIQLSAASVFYGQPVPEVTAVLDTAGNEIPSAAYDIVYPEEANDLGTYEITVVFDGISEKYKGQLRSEFKVAEDTALRTAVITKANADTGTDGRMIISNYGKELSNTVISAPETIRLSAASFDYTGNVIKPVSGVYDKNNQIIDASHYDVTYSSNPIQPAAYQVTVTFKGDRYTGSLKSSFTINKTISAKVSGLKGTAAGTTSIKLAWKKQNSADGYTIYRYNRSAKAYQKIKTITKASILSYKDTKLKAGTSYQYKICAYKINEINSGALSDALTVCTKPVKVSSVKLAVNKKTSQKLSWKKVSGADGYEIYCYNNAKKKYVKIKTVAGEKKVSYTVTKRKSGAVYRYKIRAYKKAGGKTVYGEFSKVLQKKTKER